MGANDAKEMLEAAKAECLRLERENTALRETVRQGDTYNIYEVARDVSPSDRTDTEATDDLVSALRSRLSVAEAIISRARHCVRKEYARDQIFAVLSNPLPPLPVLMTPEQPTELAELFPGTLATLDRLTIRPEVQS